jgi:ferredoxin-NADP reductase
MLAGGTGITPMIQVRAAVMRAEPWRVINQCIAALCTTALFTGVTLDHQQGLHAVFDDLQIGVDVVDTLCASGD